MNPSAKQSTPLRCVADVNLRRFGPAGRLVLGGSPTRLFRLSVAGARSVDLALSPSGVPRSPAVEMLVARLVDAGALHPVPSPIDPSGEAAAQVTVVVPVREHGPQLRRLLASLRRDPSPPAAVVVVDDASPDPGIVRSAVEDELAARGHHPPVEVVRRRSTGGPAAARNAGAAHVATDVIAFVDADCAVSDNWLAPLLGHLTDPSVALVAPRVAGCPGDGVGVRRALDRYEADHSPIDLGVDPGRVEPGTRVSYVPSAALLVRRQVFDAVGGFDESMRFGEDVDLVWRLGAAGHRSRYEPASIVHHEHRADLRSWCAQRVAYGSSAAALDERHPGRVAPAVLSPWSLGVWWLAVLGQPLAAALIGTGTAVLLRRRLSDLPSGVVVRLGVAGHVGAGRQLARATIRVWWPLAAAAGLVSRRARRVVLAVVVVESATALSDRRGTSESLNPVATVGLHLLDHMAYGAGVWLGCARRRSWRALLPRFSSS